MAIANSNTNNYTLTQSEVGKEITVGVSYTDGYGTPESLISNPTDTVTNINDIPAGNIIIDGVLNQYQTLTANTNSITDEDGMGELGYQWFSNGELIEGASTNTYILTQDQVGKTVSVQVNYTDGQGTFETVASAESELVAAGLDPNSIFRVEYSSSDGLAISKNTIYLQNGFLQKQCPPLII